MKTLFLFVDGLGLGSCGEANPFYGRTFPGFVRLFAGGPAYGLALHQTRCNDEACVRAIDVTFGVAGLPQSATGQVALFCGKPAPVIVGRHVNAYPNKDLREIIWSGSILTDVTSRGGKATFLNGYRDLDEYGKPTGKRLSASSLITMASGIPFRRREQIRESAALTHDITGEHLKSRGFDVSVLTVMHAAQIAHRVAMQYDLTLFECFLTDMAGHGKAPPAPENILGTLDRFLSEIMKITDPTVLSIALCSDHGNIEDVSVRTHTRNPVPFVLWGGDRTRREAIMETVRDISQVAQALDKWIWWC